MATDPNLTTPEDYARHRKAAGVQGSSREPVRKAVGEGRVSAFGPDKLIDRELADLQWERNACARISPEAADVAATAADQVADPAWVSHPHGTISQSNPPNRNSHQNRARTLPRSRGIKRPRGTCPIPQTSAAPGRCTQRGAGDGFRLKCDTDGTASQGGQ